MKTTWRERFIAWWCSHASPPSWPPPERCADGRLKAKRPQRTAERLAEATLKQAWDQAPRRGGTYGRNFDFHVPEVLVPGEPTVCQAEAVEYG